MESPLPPVEQRVPGRWEIGTVSKIKVETPRVKSFRIELPRWMPHDCKKRLRVSSRAS